MPSKDPERRREVDAAYRRRMDPEAVERRRQRTLAYNDATAALRLRFADEWKALYAQAVAERGVA